MTDDELEQQIADVLDRRDQIDKQRAADAVAAELARQGAPAPKVRGKA